MIDRETKDRLRSGLHSVPAALSWPETPWSLRLTAIVNLTYAFNYDLPALQESLADLESARFVDLPTEQQGAQRYSAWEEQEQICGETVVPLWIESGYAGLAMQLRYYEPLDLRRMVEVVTIGGRQVLAHRRELVSVYPVALEDILVSGGEWITAEQITPFAQRPRDP